MKNRVWIILLCFLLCLGLAACGAEEKKADEDESTEVRAERAVSVSNGDSLKEDSVALSVGKTAVSYKEFKVYRYLMRSQYAGAFPEDVWNYKSVGDTDKTIRQEAVEDILRMIIQVKVIGKAAAEQGVTLAPDEKETADYSAKNYCESLSAEEKAANHIDVSVVSSIFEDNKLASKMYNVVIGKVDVNVTPEQAQAVRVQLIYKKADPQTKGEVKESMDALCKEAQTSEYSFYTLAKSNTQADEIECLVGRLDSRTNLAKFVMGMKLGQISPVIEEPDGYYIASCVQRPCKEINEEYRNQVVEQRQTKAFQDAYKKWSDAYEVKVSKSLLSE